MKELRLEIEELEERIAPAFLQVVVPQGLRLVEVNDEAKAASDNVSASPVVRIV